MKTKMCGKCGEEKPLAEFHKNRTTGDGLQTWCKVCIRAQSAEWKRDNPEQRKEQVRRYNRQHGGKNAKAWMKSNPHKVKAQKAVYSAVVAGSIPGAAEYQCFASNCENQARDHHHWSYDRNHWLSVIPLCRKCHRGVHTGLVVLSNPQGLALSFTVEEKSAIKKIGSNSAKLSISDVLQVVELLEKGDLSKAAIARRFDVSDAAICSIAVGRTWSSVTGIQMN